VYDLKLTYEQCVYAFIFSSDKKAAFIKHIELYYEISKMSTIFLNIYMSNRLLFQKIDENERYKTHLSSSGNVLDSSRVTTDLKNLYNYGINNMVEIKIYWKLNQDFCQTLLFGKYVAEIFYEIKNSK
jgi:hypothetical protein